VITVLIPTNSGVFVAITIDIEKTLYSKNRSFQLKSCFASHHKRVVLFGPSGSGKTLTLQSIAGLLQPDQGSINIDGRVLFDTTKRINVPTRQRRIGYLFQDYALFPHLNVRQNVEFGLKKMGCRLSDKACQRVDEMLTRLDIEAIESNMPAQISGGQRQRVALARILIMQPDLLLLDEPFSALDQPLKIRMRQALLRVLDGFDIPLVMVTHDPREVELFAQTVVIFHQGRACRVLAMDEIHKDSRRTHEILCEHFSDDNQKTKKQPLIFGPASPSPLWTRTG
jgi:molybdate transport system ATP-binding protein